MHDIFVRYEYGGVLWSSEILTAAENRKGENFYGLPGLECRTTRLLCSTVSDPALIITRQ